MSTRYRTYALGALATVVLGVAACGDDEAATTTVTSAPSEPAALSEKVVPDDLVGTYAVNRPKGAFPAGEWTMAIGPRGELFIVPPGETGFFSTPVTATASEVQFPPDPDAGCSDPATYSYELEGKRPGGTLTLRADTEPCGDRAFVMAGQFDRTD
jgi:hypothetical protein